MESEHVAKFLVKFKILWKIIITTLFAKEQ